MRRLTATMDERVFTELKVRLVSENKSIRGWIEQQAKNYLAQKAE